MTVDSLPFASSEAGPLGAAEPWGEREQPWGRGTPGVASVGRAVTPLLPSVDGSAVMGDACPSEMSRKREGMAAERDFVADANEEAT